VTVVGPLTPKQTKNMAAVLPVCANIKQFIEETECSLAVIA